MLLNNFVIYTTHPVLLVPPTGRREGNFEVRGVIWIISVYTLLVRGCEWDGLLERNWRG